MSSSGAKGVQQGAAIIQKHRPNYSNDASGRRKMEKESGLDYKVNGPQVTRIKIGIRLKNSHDIESLTVMGRGRAMKLWKETAWPADEPPLGRGTISTAPLQPPVSQQCEKVYSTTNHDGTPSGDTWSGFVAKYDPTLHGSKGFDTDLIVTKVDLIPANGFEPVIVVFTIEGIMLDTGHYVVATSVLPGENSTFAHRSITLNGGGKSKKASKPSKKTSKTSKQAAAKSKKSKKRR